MERKNLMQAVADRALQARIPLSRVCIDAGVSATVAFRWQHKQSAPHLPTIGKLETALDRIERSKQP